jgi:hypothetical protein
MTTDYAIETLHLLVSLAGLWVLFFVLFKDYRIDALRQRLFNLRGELFEYAASGAIPFSHPAYGMLRVRINRLIRFAHRFTSTQLLFVVVAMPPAPRDPLERWNEALQTIDSEDVRNKLRAFNNRMLATLVWHLVSGSVVLLTSLALFAMAWTMKHLWERCSEFIKRAMADVLRDAIDHDHLFDGYVRRFPVEQLEAQAFEITDSQQVAA